MSRLGKKPVTAPKGVKVSINGQTIQVEGPKGKLSQTFPEVVRLSWSEDEKSVSIAVDEKDLAVPANRAMWGTARALIANMMEGAATGYSKTLEIVGVGWGAQLQGQKLVLKLGYANPVEVDVPQGVNVSVEKQIVKVDGADKQAVGQFAAVVRSKRKPEPYNGKGIKYSGEVIKKKQGKQFGS